MADGAAAVVAEMGAAPKKKDDVSSADLAKLKRMVEDWRTLTADARLDSEVSIDYYDTKQWTSAEKAVLANRHQPDIAFNRIKPAVNGMIGVTEKGRSDPRAWPRTPKDEDSADVATDILRYVADASRFNRTKQDCFLDMLVPGTMAAFVGMDADLQVTIEQIRWEEFIHDPRSRRKDFEDGRYRGIAKWQYVDDVMALYPDVERESLEAVVDTGLNISGGLDDRPLSGAGGASWIDRRNRRILLVELYHKEAGAWHRSCFHAGAVLKSGPSPYLDAKGRPCCPIEAQSAYVDRDNARYGVVKDMRGPQDEINKRRSKLLHMVSVSQIQAVDPSAMDVDAATAREEAARPDGVIPFGWQKVSQADQAAGQAQLLAEAKSEIERLGPNPAVVGRDNADASGRALQARTQAGLIELGLIYGGREDWELRIYRQAWARVKQYWTAEQYIRVTDDEDAPKFVGVNAPKGAPVIDPATGQPQVDPKTGKPMEGEPVIDPVSKGSVFGYKNIVSEMDVDIMVETVQDVVNIQAEQFQDLVQLVGSNPAYAQEVPFSVMLKLSAVPHKRQIIDELKAIKEGAGAQKAPDPREEIALKGALAGIDKTVSETELNRARARTEGAKPEIEGAKLEAGREKTIFTVSADQAEAERQRQHEAVMAVMPMATFEPQAPDEGPLG